MTKVIFLISLFLSRNYIHTCRPEAENKGLLLHLDFPKLQIFIYKYQKLYSPLPDSLTKDRKIPIV